MAKITRLSLYIINRVKIRRLVLGYSAEGLSVSVKRGHGYVLTAEDATIKSQYPIREIPALAQQLKLDIHDFLPPEEMDQTSSGELVDKIVISLDNLLDVKLILEALIDFGFFKKSKALAETVDHLAIVKSNQVEVLEMVMKNAVNEGLLKQENGFFIS